MNDTNPAAGTAQNGAQPQETASLLFGEDLTKWHIHKCRRECKKQPHWHVRGPAVGDVGYWVCAEGEFATGREAIAYVHQRLTQVYL